MGEDGISFLFVQLQRFALPCQRKYSHSIFVVFVNGI